MWGVLPDFVNKEIISTLDIVTKIEDCQVKNPYIKDRQIDGEEVSKNNNYLKQ